MRHGSPRGIARRAWRRGHLVPLLLVLVAGWQFYHVRTAGWSSWRGGGFGMYAGFHPRHTEAWIWLAGDPQPIRVLRDTPTPAGYAPALQACLVRANEGCLRRALRRLPDEAAVQRIQVWRLSFEPSSALLRRDLLVEIAPGGQP